MKYLYTRIPTPIPRIPTLIPRISTLIPHIPRIPDIHTPIPRIPTLITCVSIIPIIPFPSFPFRLLQIAQSNRMFGVKHSKTNRLQKTIEYKTN